jgi:NADH-quinone oxidoreductase subunit G
VIVGQAALRGSDGEAVLAHAQRIAELGDSGLLVLHTAASRVGAMDVGAVTDGGIGAALEGADVVWNLGADEIEIAGGPLVIYQGHHGDRGAHRADIILPGAAWTEEAGLFVNTEGRPQLALRAGFPPGEAKENWAILRAVSAEAGRTQPWNTLAELRRALVKAVPHLEIVDRVPENEGAALPRGKLATGPFGLAGRTTTSATRRAGLGAHGGAFAERGRAPVREARGRVTVARGLGVMGMLASRDAGATRGPSGCPCRSTSATRRCFWPTTS